MTLDALIAWFAASPYSTMALGLLVLVIVDVILGVGSALKRKVFDWQVLSNFYRTNVVPKVFGWVGSTMLLQLVATANMPEQIQAIVSSYVAPGADLGFYGAVVMTLVMSISSNYKELTAPDAPTQPKEQP
jgi:hypothetical protein